MPPKAKKKAAAPKRRQRPTKTGSFTMRINPSTKDILDAAAADEGVSLAVFLERAGLARAADRQRQRTE